MTLDELIEKLASQYDVEEICDLLEISAEDILNVFDFRVAENYEKAVEATEE